MNNRSNHTGSDASAYTKPLSTTTVKLNFTKKTASTILPPINQKYLFPNIHPLVEFVHKNPSSFESTVSNNEPHRIQPSLKKQLEDILKLSKSLASLNPNVKQSLKEGDCVFLLSYVWFHRWKRHCESEGAEPTPREIYNWDLVQSSNTIQIDKYNYSNCKFELKESLVENKDYIVVTGEIWEALHCWWEGGPPLPRIVLNSKADRGTGELSTLHSTLHHLSNNGTEIINYIDMYPATPLSLIEAEKGDDYRINESTKALRISSDASVTSPTTTKRETKLVEQRCFICNGRSTVRCSKCHAIDYCGDECQRAHWRYHKVWCSTAQLHASLSKAEFDQKVCIGKKGKMGLFNLGNSCYLNSCLQCLSHVFPVTTFFLSGKYKKEINLQSMDGTGGKLATEYANLLFDLWFGNEKAISIVSLKQVLGTIRPEYAGSQQHDAHEVVELLLDKLHEDLNRVTKKPYTERPEGNGTNDDAIAAEAWSKHLLRENSIITDNFGSLMRNELTCPDCGKLQVSFDYQQSLQVAIPSSITNRVIKILYVPSEIPKIFAQAMAGLPVEKMAKLQQYRMIVMRPVLFAFETHANSVLQEVMKRFEVELRNYTSSLVHDLQSNVPGFAGLVLKDFDNVYKTDSLRLYSMGGSHVNEVSCLTKQYDLDNDVVKGIRPDGVIGAYNTLDIDTPKVVLLQRKILLGERIDPEIIGLPNVLNCDLKWSFLRLRFFIWQQVSRLIVADVERFERQGLLARTIEAIKDAILKNDVVRQMEFCKLLPLRFVRQFGQPLYINIPPGVQQTSSFKMDPDIMRELDMSRHQGLDRLLGTSLPCDKDILLSRIFQAEDEFMFVSMDWCGPWLTLLNANELMQTTEHVSCTALNINGNSSKRNNITLEKCLEEHTREELLDEENAWYCSVCKKHQNAKKRVSFWETRLPKVLVIVLKRFEISGRNLQYREKIETEVDFPLNGLDLSKFFHKNESNRIKDKDDDDDDDDHDNSLYDLFGVCNHYGRMGFGHYSAYARDYKDDELSKQWYSFDDDVVEECRGDDDVVSKNAYILFYKRRKYEN